MDSDQEDTETGSDSINQSTKSQRTKIILGAVLLLGVCCFGVGLVGWLQTLLSPRGPGGGTASCTRASFTAELNTSLTGQLVILVPQQQPAWSPWYYWNLGSLTEMPAYGISPTSVEDIQTVVKTAHSCGMTVNTKVHGHSYFGASADSTDIVVSMSEHFNEVQVNDGHANPYYNSCGSTWLHTTKVGGGASWIEVYRALGPNYTSVGGACDSVSAAGGWLLSNGLGLQSQRKLGLGVDNVLEFKVVLANGDYVTADACTNPDLFAALRGGGGGFGIITSVVYKLHPGSPIQEFRLGFDRSKFNLSGNVWNDDYWDLVVKHTFAEDRWALWPAQHISLDEFGASSKFIIWMYFEGELAEAISSDVYKDFETWTHLAPAEARINVHRGFPTFQQYKVQERIVSAEMSGVRNYKDPGVNGNFPYYGNRLIPAKFLIDNPLAARNMFQSLEGYTCDNFYHMGGAIQRYGNSTLQMASPAIRESAWQIGLCDLSKLEMLRDMFPDNISGTGHNHAGWNEPNWRDSFWGKTNFEQLVLAKAKFDPHHVFKCRHCVGSDEL